MENVLDRFLRYVHINTESKAGEAQIPSTPGQFDLARLLVQELRQMGLKADVDENCYVYATLPGNCPDAPVIGFISHMDTSPALSGANVNARLVDYQGGDIELGTGIACVWRPIRSWSATLARRWSLPTAPRSWDRTTSPASRRL